MSRDGKLIYRLTIGVIVVFSVAGFVFGKWPERLAMEPLVAFVLETGSPTRVSETALKYFDVIDDPGSFHELRADSESGRTRAIQVRRRESGDFDVFLLELLPNGTSGHFYLTTQWGRLWKAAYLGDKPEAIDNAQEKFQSELDFWKHWRLDKLK